jgi:VanZ family protein
MKQMRLIFFIFSIGYIVAIFLFAGSPVVSDLAAFNTNSLLHIPLYGILTTLLIFSFVPVKLNRMNGSTHQRINASTYLRFFPPVFITLMVAIVDEIYQSVIPIRNASVTDVFLDAIGIALAIFFVLKFYRKKKSLIHLS